MWEAHNWSKATRLGIGLVTAIPVTVGWVLLLRMLFAGSRSIPDLGPIASVLVVGFPVMMFMVLLLYVPAVLNNARLGPGFRFLWIVGFFVAGPLAFPAYWFREVLRAPYAPDEDVRPPERSLPTQRGAGPKRAASH